MASINSCYFLISLMITLSFSNLPTSDAARSLLPETGLPPLSDIQDSAAAALPPLTSQQGASSPSAGSPSESTQPQTPSSSLMPKVSMPHMPEVSLPPMSDILPSIPSAKSVFPFFSTPTPAAAPANA